MVVKYYINPWVFTILYILIFVACGQTQNQQNDAKEMSFREVQPNDTICITRKNEEEIIKKCVLKNDTTYVHGPMEKYYLNGQLKVKAMYRNNVPDGKAIAYYENGVRKHEYLFDMGEMVHFIKYFENGNVFKESEYKNGTRIISHVYEYDGTKDKTFQFDMMGNVRKLHGYDANENLSLTWIYKEETDTIEWVLTEFSKEINYYQSSGVVKDSVSFDDNYKKHGIYRAYHANGNLKTDGQYYHGNKAGKWEYYDNNKTLLEVKKYDKEGKLVKSKKY